MELLELMQQDSYMRFIASDYYQRYKRNEIVPRSEARSVSNTHTGSSKEKEKEQPFSNPGTTTISAQQSSPNDSRIRFDSLAASGTGESKVVDPLSGGWAYEGDTSGRKASEISAPLTGALSSSLRVDSPFEGSTLHVELTALRDAQADRTETVHEGDTEEEHDDQQLVFNFNPLGATAKE
eukprot:TRINITY_DN3125_c0_g1_i6.p1 TRINITY_DN3125_c0_g1~~TRINITY_DN3125_c0_g1_i6.p1  ORF type:complete len:204 (-),score=33.84 TRINITY_DN3125_c0_g1_i6:88-630(-)